MGGDLMKLYTVQYESVNPAILGGRCKNDAGFESETTASLLSDELTNEPLHLQNFWSLYSEFLLEILLEILHKMFP